MSVVVSGDRLALVPQAKQSLNLEHQVTKRKQILVEVEGTLDVASSTTLLAQHRHFARTEVARKHCEELKNAEDRFG